MPPTYVIVDGWMDEQTDGWTRANLNAPLSGGIIRLLQRGKIKLQNFNTNMNSFKGGNPSILNN